MSNKFFNFRYPEFIEKYGLDWSTFKTEVSTFVDLIVKKVFDLYKIKNINTMSNQVVERQMRLKKIPIDPSDTLAQKKLKLRQWVSREKKKSLEDIYLDVAEQVVGTRGVVYSELVFGAFAWDESVWPDTSNPDVPGQMSWSGDNWQFNVYIDVKTLVSAELDEIERLYLERTLRPSYYQIYLIDSDFNILRTVQ